MKNPQSILEQYFKHEKFRGVQETIINKLVNGNGNALVIMPTGSGKSLCYQIPAMLFEGGTIVISPLIALMQDQVDALRRKNIPAAFVNSTLSRDERDKRINQFEKGDIKLLYVTPERFRKVRFVESMKRTNISLLAVDEAHCISEWGHDFRPDYSRIGEFRKLIGSPLTVALTATATLEVQEDIISKLGIPITEIEIFHQGIQRPNLRLETEDIFDEKQKFELIFQVLKEYDGAGIIYFALIQTLEKFSQILNDKGFDHALYHGKLPDKERKQTQRKFMSGDQNLILATNAFGMGIDKPDIRFVIHADIPSSIEQYYQEIGRAGRDGLDSLCLLLYNQDDLYTQMEFIKWSNPDADFYSALYDILQRDILAVNSLGVDYIREQLNYKNRKDFRLETSLGMLDRYGVIEGDLDRKNLTLIKQLPVELEDEKRLSQKLLSDNKKLLAMVNYFKSDKCRRVYISEYFGFNNEKSCGNCDNCERMEGI